METSFIALHSSPAPNACFQVGIFVYVAQTDTQQHGKHSSFELNELLAFVLHV